MTLRWGGAGSGLILFKPPTIKKNLPATHRTFIIKIYNIAKVS